MVVLLPILDNFPSNNSIVHHSNESHGSGSSSSKSNYSLLNHGFGSSLIILLVYVDDIILADHDSSCVDNVQLPLCFLFRLKILGSLQYFLHLEIAKSARGVSLNKRKYIFT